MIMCLKFHNILLTSCSFLDFTQTQAARILKPSASLILVESGLTFPEKSFFKTRNFHVHGVFLSKLFDIDAEIQTLSNCVTFAHPIKQCENFQ